MKKTIILLGFKSKSDSNLDTFAANVLACMTANDHFRTPTPPLADVEAAHQLYTNALTVAQSRDRFLVAQKNEARLNLVAILIRLANYVTLVADGNRAIYISSGFPVNPEQPVTETALKEVQNFSVTLGRNSGEAILSVDPVKGAKFYLFYYAPVGETSLVWLHESDTVTSFTITGLDPLKTYAFQVTVKGTRKKFAKTDIITKTVV